MTNSNSFDRDNELAGVLILEDGFTLDGIKEIQQITLMSANFLEKIGLGVHLVSYLSREEINEGFPYTVSEKEMILLAESRRESYVCLPYDFTKKLRHLIRERSKGQSIIELGKWKFSLANFN